MTGASSRLPDRLALEQAARELTGPDRLWQRLHALLADAEVAATENGAGGKKQKAAASPSPWNDEAGDLLTTIHGEARRFESALTLLLFRSARYRGGDDRNTLACIGQLPALIDLALERHPRGDSQQAASDEHLLAATAARSLVSWPRLARALFGEQRKDEERWTSAPGYLQCPHCARRLQLAPGWQDHPESADVWCRACPARVTGDEPGPDQTLDRRWPPTAWIGVLQETAG